METENCKKLDDKSNDGAEKGKCSRKPEKSSDLLKTDEVQLELSEDAFPPAIEEKEKPVRSRKSILEEHGLILGKVIGYGSYAKVKVAYSAELGREVAVKIISKLKAPADYTKKFLPREIDAVKGLHHENLIQFYQSIETSHRVYLVMQLAQNGTLLDYIREKKYLNEEVARKLFCQLISAIAYIHSKGVVHRDIKCENLLLDLDYNLKLIDFGFARKDTMTAENTVILSKTFCGSYAYASPEILKAVAYNPFLSDIWATGVVCYAMVFGRLPYDGSNVQTLLKLVNSSLVFPKSPRISTECKYLIFHILAPLNIRYRIPQIQKDPWFNGKSLPENPTTSLGLGPAPSTMNVRASSNVRTMPNVRLSSNATPMGTESKQQPSK